MLTGNKELDLENLTNIYNAYGKTSLTKNYDVNYEILKKLDIQSLSKYCRTNQYAKNICNDPDFWQSKFMYDNLPLNAILIPPVSTNDWIREYVLVSEAYKNVFNILKINEVEKNRKEDRTDGLIVANMGEFIIDENTQYKILSMFIDDVDFNNDYSLKITENDNVYRIAIESYDQMVKMIYNQPIAVDLLINILTILLKINARVVTDNSLLPFIVVKRYIEFNRQYNPNEYDLYHVRLIKRLGMLELLNNL